MIEVGDKQGGEIEARTGGLEEVYTQYAKGLLQARGMCPSGVNLASKIFRGKQVFRARFLVECHW